jgi:hypothetical protein
LAAGISSVQGIVGLPPRRKSIRLHFAGQGQYVERLAGLDQDCGLLDTGAFEPSFVSKVE